jgi:hypothetical protein
MPGCFEVYIDEKLCHSKYGGDGPVNDVKLKVLKEKIAAILSAES